MRWSVPAVILSGGLALRLGWLLLPAGRPDGDEAVFGLMALQIAEGRDYPLYCWGAHYGGALASYLGAAVFRLVGVSTAAFRSVTLPFVAGYLIVTYAVARLALDARSARVALLFAAVPPAIPLAYSLKIGGYAELLCIGGALLLLTFRLPSDRIGARPLRWRLGALGFLAGFGLYTFPLILPHLAVVGGFLLTRRRWALARLGWVWLLLGFGAGVSPLVIHNLLFPFATPLRLGSRVLDVSRHEVLQSGTGIGTILGWIGRYASSLPAHLLTALGNAGPLFGLEGRLGAVLAWSLIVGAAWALVGRDATASPPGFRAEVGRWCAWLIVAVVCFAWVAGLHRPRHLVPLFSVLPIGCAALCDRWGRTRPWAAWALCLVAIGTAGWSLVVAAPIPAGAPIQPLIQTADRLGVRGVYADYDIAYVAMYASHERLLASPTAWAHGTVISDRTPEITRQVDQIPAPGYVFWRDSPQAAWFLAGLERRGIRFHRHPVGPLDLITDLSTPIRSPMFPVTEHW
jgi:hypothetical protein